MQAKDIPREASQPSPVTDTTEAPRVLEERPKADRPDGLPETEEKQAEQSPEIPASLLSPAGTRPEEDIATSEPPADGDSSEGIV